MSWLSQLTCRRILTWIFFITRLPQVSAAGATWNQPLFLFKLDLGESAISTNQRFSSSLHSGQHRAVREHGERLRAAGLSIPGPGALLLHQHVLAGASTDTVTVESIYQIPSLTADDWNQVWYNFKSRVGGNNRPCLMWREFSFICISVDFIVM